MWTIGHSNRPWDAFLECLAAHDIRCIADVRRFPGSRRQPQYAQAALEDALRAHEIDYHWLPELGGRRQPRPDSRNTAWRNPSFRGYADHMSSVEFAAGLERLLKISTAGRTALMCAEALWWRCHRALIADALSVRGITVIHILSVDHTVVHPFTSAARIVDGRLTYD